jgi:hypothetical protein
VCENYKIRNGDAIKKIIMKPAQSFNKLIVIAALILVSMKGKTQNNSRRPFIDTIQYKTVRVKPSVTNTAIRTWDTAHAVYYDAKIKNNKILLWLAGTNGTPLNVPVELLNTALGQGYKIIALSYITVPAVSQLCKDEALDANTECAASFRRKRIYGDNDFSLISDKPQDAIIPRFVNLLQWVVKNDSSGNWSQYLNREGVKPMWNKVAVAGQSQGGGMAQYIGKQETVARIISFSGGWDYANSKEKKIAAWYFNKAVTPMQNWYATYNTNEMAANPLKDICTAMQIPAGNVFALDKPLFNATAAKENANPYHGDGIRNTAYKPIWITMLGSGVEISE